jgi:hypothetical protein
MEFISALFEHLFEKDSGIALTQFEIYIGLSAKTDKAFEDKLTLDNRKVRFYKVAGNESFTVWIYLKK